MTEKVFPAGSPEPPALITKVFRQVSPIEGISYLRIDPDTEGGPNWIREGYPAVRYTWPQINGEFPLRDASRGDNRPGSDKPTVTLAEGIQIIAEHMGAEADDIAQDIRAALERARDDAESAENGVMVVNMSAIERKFSLAASDPGAYAARRSYPADGGGVDYEPVSSWVAHACAHVAIAMLPQLATFQTLAKPEPPAPVTTLTAEQLEDMAVATHRQGCYDGCDVHTMTAFRENLLRSLGAAGVLVVNVPPTKVAEIRMNQHRELVSVVTGVPIEELP